MSSRKIISLVIITAFAVSGCSKRQFYSVREDIVSGRSQGAVINDFSYEKQRPSWCGPAALSAVLRFWGMDISQEEIADSIYLEDIKGTLTIDLERYAFNRGFFARGHEAGIEELGDRIREGIPVIVIIQLYPVFKNYHYLVVFGYDDDAELVIAYDGEEKPALISYFNFIRKWRSADYWMLEVCPPDKVDWELDAYYINRLGFLYQEEDRLDKALLYYKEAIKKDALNPLYSYNAANVYLEKEDFNKAIELYKKSILLDETYADSYNNLAYCYYRKNEKLDEAIVLGSKAIELAPDKKHYYLDTLGLIYSRQNKYDKARGAFTKALENTPPDNMKAQETIRNHLKSLPAR